MTAAIIFLVFLIIGVGLFGVAVGSFSVWSAGAILGCVALLWFAREVWRAR